ncbi:MAG: glutathione peroxidase [Alphaproteobacteria bacterium]|nr:glutathione peroxidase [Alphaproteobacteria bacterium]
MTGNAHDFSFEGIEGGTIALKDFSGPVLLVNTASACGLTPQYAGLQALHERYAPRGFSVLGVPSNDFGAQEPGTEDEVKTFCETRFGVTFPLTAKQAVIGAGAHPFYRWIGETLGEGALPKWNFHKYLIGPDGTVREVFGSRVPPEDAALAKAVEAALG